MAKFPELFRFMALSPSWLKTENFCEKNSQKNANMDSLKRSSPYLFQGFLSSNPLSDMAGRAEWDFRQPENASHVEVTEREK